MLEEAQGGHQAQREITVVGKHGRTAVLEVVSQPIYHDGEWVGVQSIARDITERKRAEAMLEHQALHDALTDLPNRTLLYDRTEQAIFSARRHNQRIALLLMDLDHFKEINDTFGHHHGDLVLQEAARRLSDVLRESDTVARLGGDEFAVLLPMTDEAGAMITAEKLLEALSAPFAIEDHSLHLGASIGIAHYPEHGENAAGLLRRADVAMYVAKRGKTGSVVYAPEHDENTPGRLQMISDLRRATEQDELVLHYQPKVGVHSGRVESVEALIRWNHPELGMIPPDQFLPLAEHSGLIKQLALWVLNAALRQCRLWQDAGINLRVAVNLSVENLRDPQLVGSITDLLKTWQVLPDSLQIEITESTIMVDPTRTMRTLTRLKEMGVKIALDDFGTGYSSLAYLRQLPVHEIKIDRSFISDLGTSENGLSIVRTINDLGQGLGMEIVAEGVEDRETLEVLALIGCDTAQGYYLSRPVPAADLSVWLEDRSQEFARASA
jgi:diguanylate cyclase (GGDEF)-like protein